MITRTQQNSLFSIHLISAFKFLVFLMTLVIIWQVETSLVMAVSPTAEVERTGLSAKVHASLARTALLTPTTTLTPTAASPADCATAEEKPAPSSQRLFSIRGLL